MDEFQTSDFFIHWNGLLSNKTLLTYLKEKDTIIYLSLHIALKRFSDLFYRDEHVIHAGQNELQDLIACCGMLVTDYSSVSFDVLFLDKPVLYYHYDYPSEEYGPTNQYIDYLADLPGPVCYDTNTIVSKIIGYIENRYRFDPSCRKRRDRFFDYIDDHNCDRIFNTIKQAM